MVFEKNAPFARRDEMKNEKKMYKNEDIGERETSGHR
jgi:hypothetical protein